MLFLLGLLLGTFFGFVLAGLCNVARENRVARSTPSRMADSFEEVA